MILSEFINKLKSDYQLKFNTPLAVISKLYQVISMACETYGEQRLRAMWNEYLDDPEQESTLDMSKFLHTTTLNKYGRALGARLAGKNQSDQYAHWNAYHCELNLADKTTGLRPIQSACNHNGTALLECSDKVHSDRCKLCGGALLREDVFEAINFKRRNEVKP